MIRGDSSAKRERRIVKAKRMKSKEKVNAEEIGKVRESREEFERRNKTIGEREREINREEECRAWEGEKEEFDSNGKGVFIFKNVF